MKPFVFVTGMFRSGTTLMARILGRAPQLACASDTYQPLLKAFRNELAVGLRGAGNVDLQAPFDDYYFHPDKQAEMLAVRQGSLDRPLTLLSLDELRQQIASYCKDFSPRLVEELDGLAGRTFAELFASGVEAVERAYGTPDSVMAAMKITWSGEFAPLLLRHFPEARIIHVVRDPRAVCASKYGQPGRKYPFLFLARQWRKLAACAWMDAGGAAGRTQRVLRVQYERLTRNSRETIQEICDFLGIAFDERLLGDDGFTDGGGRRWDNNSTFGMESPGISAASVERWRQVLSPEQTAYVERLCLGEMLLHGYAPERAGSGEFQAEQVFFPPEVPAGELAQWIRPYAAEDSRHLLRELALESLRASTLAAGAPQRQEVRRALCLFEDLFEPLSAAIRHWQNTCKS